MRILFVSPYIPSTVRVRPYEWLKALAHAGHQVHLIALRPPEDEWADANVLGAFCSRIDVLPLSRVRTLCNTGRAVLSTQPLQYAYSRHPIAERLIAHHARDCDVVHIEHLRGAVLASRVHDVPRVLDAVDSISALFQATKSHSPSVGGRLLARLEHPRTARWEAEAPSGFDRVTVTSEVDRAAFANLAGGHSEDRIVTIPNGVDLDEFLPSADAAAARPTIIFTGKLSYHANVAAAERLVNRIMPHVWDRLPNVAVVLAGKDPAKSLLRLRVDPRVTVTGYVRHMASEITRAWVSACPLVYGAGIQNKILEAMACGVPVVCSSSAVSALQCRPNHEVLVADDDAAFAHALIDLVSNRERGLAIGAAGRAYVERQHRWSALCERLVGTYVQARESFERASRTASAS